MYTHSFTGFICELWCACIYDAHAYVKRGTHMYVWIVCETIHTYICDWHTHRHYTCFVCGCVKHICMCELLRVNMQIAKHIWFTCVNHTPTHITCVHRYQLTPWQCELVLLVKQTNKIELRTNTHIMRKLNSHQTVRARAHPPKQTITNGLPKQPKSLTKQQQILSQKEKKLDYDFLQSFMC